MAGEKFTLGPWEARVARLRPDTEVFGYSVTAHGKTPPIGSAGVHVPESLTVSRDIREAKPGWFTDYFTPAEVEANAHLIASAPELYDALTAMFAEFGEECPDGECAADCPHRIASAALSKARGESIEAAR